MKPDELVGYVLNQASAITAITSTRIYYGLRPNGTVVPCINYYDSPSAPAQYGVKTSVFTINCRTASAQAARNLARLVETEFHGIAGKYGTDNGFDVIRSSCRGDSGVIPEPADELFNAPVTIQIVYHTDTVS